jgi:hypothetical protein
MPSDAPSGGPAGDAATSHDAGSRPDAPGAGDRAAQDTAAAGDRTAPGADRGTPPGLREQVQATRDAVTRMVRAHMDLARAEADAIKGEIARAAALGGAAIALLILLAFLLPIGLALFLGEWIFGSIGWGLLHATELLIALPIMLVLLALRVRGLAVDLVIAVVIAIVASVILGTNAGNQAFQRIGEAASFGDPAWRPLVVGILVGAAIGAVVGLIAGVRPGGAGGALGGLVAGAILGGWVGAFLAITFGWRTGIAAGIAIGLVAWPTLMGTRVARQGIDGEALKARFWPQATIDTTKETIEWARARAPIGPKS